MFFQQSLKWFYLLTPAFVLFDYLFGWNIRVSFLQDMPGWKLLYYVFCFAIGLLMMRYTLLEPILGLIEAGINLLLLTLSVLMPYYQAIENISQGNSVPSSLDHLSIINYLLTGCVLIVSWYLKLSSLENKRL